LAVGRPADPHLTADAATLGCSVEAAPQPHTSSGWPSQEAVASARQASLDGLRLAQAIRKDGRYRASLIAQLDRVWLPEAASEQDLTQVLAVDMLARMLGMTPPPVTSLSSRTAQAISGDQMSALPVLLLAWLRGFRLSIEATATKGEERSDVFTAAVLELKHKLTGEAKFHATAVEQLEKLATGDNLYRLSLVPHMSKQPSIIATAVASWILNRTFPSDAIRRARLCLGRFRCKEIVIQGTLPEPALRLAGIVAASVDRDAASFPLAL
jgi:hypothetical protein